MRETIPIAAAAAVFALILGAAGMYLLMPQEAPGANRAEDTPQPAASLDGAALDQPEAKGREPDKSADTAELERLLTDKRTEAEKLARDNDDLRGELATLGKDKQTLEEEKGKLAARIAELENLAAGPNRLLISFGKWSEMKEVREADWEGLGDAYVKMTPLLQAYAKAAAEGKSLDPDLGKQLRDQNSRLVNHYLKVRGKLPTNGSANGEFTHPINLVNYLAAQLDHLGLPLSDDQKKQLAELGEEFDARWERLIAGYTEATWELQKLIDECDLKQWFYEAMFAVTTPEQRDAAVPPELQGLVGLDLYSPGLLLQAYMDEMAAPDVATLKTNLKDLLSKQLAVARESLDNADYIFDEWLNALQLQPGTPQELSCYRTVPVLNAAKAELAALQALDRDIVTDEDARKRIRAVQSVAVPQLMKQE